MEVQHISNSPHMMNVQISDLMRPLFSSSGKVQVPVSGAVSLANFTYVQGVPAREGEGFPLSKLQILDSIIANLVSLRDKRSLSTAPNNPATLDPNQLEAVIDDMAKKLQVASTKILPGLSPSMGQSFGMAISQTGAAFSLSA